LIKIDDASTFYILQSLALLIGTPIALESLVP